MKDVKKNLKVISRNMNKEFLIDFTLFIVKESIVKSAIQYISHPAAKTAVRVAGVVGYLEASKHFTIEEDLAIVEAISDMVSGGKTSEEIETESIILWRR